MQLNVK